MATVCDGDADSRAGDDHGGGDSDDMAMVMVVVMIMVIGDGDADNGHRESNGGNDHRLAMMGDVCCSVCTYHVEVQYCSPIAKYRFDVFCFDEFVVFGVCGLS